VEIINYLILAKFFQIIIIIIVSHKIFNLKEAISLLKTKKEIRKIKKKVRVSILCSYITINQVNKIINLKNKHQMQEEELDRQLLRTLTISMVISSTLIIFPSKTKLFKNLWVNRTKFLMDRIFKVKIKEGFQAANH